MSETLKAVILDLATGQQIERPLTESEIAEREASHAAYLELQKQADAKVAARESALAKLKALGLTQAEISAL